MEGAFSILFISLYMLNKINLLFLTIFLSFCTQQDSNYNVTVSTSKSIKVQEEAVVHISNLRSDFALSHDGRYISFTNFGSPPVVIIDMEGNYITHVGESGSGPEELQSPMYHGFNHDNQLAVYDTALDLVKVYDIDSGLADTHPGPFTDGINPESHALHHCDNKWYSAIHKPGEVQDTSIAIFGVFDQNFKLIEKAGRADEFMAGKRSVLAPPVIDIHCGDGKLFATHEKTPFITKYDTDNFEIKHRTTEIPESFNLSDQFRERADASFFDFMKYDQSGTAALYSHDDLLIHHYIHYTDKFIDHGDIILLDNYIAAYSRGDMQYQGQVKIDGYVGGMTSEGELVVLKDDDPENFTLAFKNITID